MTLLDRINANPLPFAQLLAIEFISAEPDGVAARMLVRPDLCTLGGFVHGGAIMSFADTLGGAAAFANLPAGAKGTTTIESKTNFIGAAAVGVDADWPFDAHPSGPPHVGLADPHRDRRRQTRGADHANPDDPVRRRPPFNRQALSHRCAGAKRGLVRAPPGSKARKWFRLAPARLRVG